jgi:hypothetical protein
MAQKAPQPKGATGAVMQPLSQAVLLEAFEPRDRGKAMGFWGLGVVAAPILGPVLGGWLTDNYSWRWVFYINIPVGVAGVIMTRLFVWDPSYLKRRSQVVDYLGIGLLAIGISTLQVALDKGQQEDWLASPFIVGMLIAAISSLVGFVWRELATEHPVVDLRVFRNATYSLGLAITAVLGFILYGSLVLLPVMLQTLMGYPPLQAGIAMAPRGMGSFIAMPLVGIATQKFDGRRLVAFGLILGVHAVLAILARSERRLLGPVLAAVPAGIRARPPVRAAHDDHDGADREGADGQRDQPLQPDAKPGRRHRHRVRHDDAGAAPGFSHGRADLTRQPVRHDQRRLPRKREELLHRPRRRHGHYHTARLRRGRRHGGARSRDALLHRSLLDTRRAVPGDGALALLHEAAGKRGSRNGRGIGRSRPDVIYFSPKGLPSMS